MEFNSLDFNLDLKNNDKIKVDKDGNKYVNVERYNSNSCLSQIIADNYDLETANIELYSDKYYLIEKQAMEANKNIYNGSRGTAGGRGLANTVLYDGEEFILPELSEKPSENANLEPVTPEPPKLEEVHEEPVQNEPAPENEQQKTETS